MRRFNAPTAKGVVICFWAGLIFAARGPPSNPGNFREPITAAV